MVTRPNSTLALVLGSGITALGVMRILGRRGIPTQVRARDPGPIRFSRWFKAAPGAETSDFSGGLAEYLSSGTLERAVLIPCSDHLALEVARLDSDLAQRFPSCLPPINALETLTDKALFYRLLEKVGIPFPKTEVQPQSEERGGIPAEGPDGLFLKPVDSQTFFQQHQKKAFWLSGDHAVGAGRMGELIQSGGVMVQEYVPGPASNHYFIDGFTGIGGKVLALLARQRLRMYPTDFGNSSYMVTVPPKQAAGAISSLSKLLKALDYRGVFSAEFKKDERDGIFRILEVNARPWWFVEFSALCGIDVVTMAYRAATGEETPPVTEYQLGRRLIHPYYDVFACKHATSSFGGFLKTFLSSLVGASQPMLSWRDPIPALAFTSKLSIGLVGRRLRTITSVKRNPHES